MSAILDPREIYARAAEAGLTIAELSQRAGFASSTFVRWKARQSSITVRNYERVMAVLHEAEAQHAKMVRRRKIQTSA
jgi:lambda repressor-like predicted transcriptional regulator